MIELKNDALNFTFPKVHPQASLHFNFQRTLRIPDDGSAYSLPPGLGSFPLRHVDDYAKNVPAQWIKFGGVILPMYQSEAMWLSFGSEYVEDHGAAYPFAIKVAAGKIDAVTGKEWTNAIHKKPQDYMVAPPQPWLDGYCIEKGIIRQFVAMPLGSGFSAEEQITGKGEYGGLQIIVYPMKREVFEKRFPKIRLAKMMRASMAEPLCECLSAPLPNMGLAPGGRMEQEIYDDPFDFEDWDTAQASRCFVHISNSLVWRAITGEQPPSTPLTAREYTDAGYPWFSYYDDAATAMEGAEILKKLKSVMEMGRSKGDNPLPENESVTPDRIIQLRNKLKKDQVREGEWV
ncbi:MAG: hypothetical protein KJ970_17635 [Candidatus Eisenbacteria bacterium]|uniref:Integral membrane protein n=1 Tax=Eiseniibacteriota bacterium TaxID=2212470 RepID=A0A948S0S2_UNCEI|nr:hypothetical protein [Candidatus Eisenbacteria bacterium]MBU1949674.1 hypothetical protein [Candidatus Eisenbacteria bacterium]MBU2692742.1 hypothetical protein [Candidatus Eisenbacteria bacterium]